MNTEDDEFARIAREQALNKMAENARELGLNYELPITMQAGEFDCTHAERLCAELKLAEQPTQQEPDDSNDLTIAYMAGVQRGKELTQRTWVGLTDEEMDDCWNKLFGTGNYNRRNVYRAIEAKLKEKNNG